MTSDMQTAGLDTLLARPGNGGGAVAPHIRSGPDMPAGSGARPEPGHEPVEAIGADGELTAVGMELLSVPEVAFVLIAAGLLATTVWAAHPHLWPVGVSAAPLLVGGSTGLHALSPSAAAVLLLVLTAASLAMEVYMLPGLLLHAAGGATGLAVAGLFLEGPGAGAHPTVVVPAALVVGLGCWAAARGSWRATRIDPFATSSRLVGRELVVLDVADGRVGHAVVAGFIWVVRDPERPLREGSKAHVIEQHGDELLVRQCGGQR